MLAVAKEYFVDLYRLFYPNLCGGCDVPLVKSEKAFVHTLSIRFAIYKF